MSVSICPTFGVGWQGFTSGGIPLNAGLINTYAAGGTTPQATYTTSAGNVQCANPIVLGADGRPTTEIWLTDGVSYRFDLTDSLGNLIKSYDNITGQGTISTNLAASSGSSLVGFIASGGSASARTVQAKLRDVVSVKDFGATGDGNTDDTVAVQAAVTAGSAVYFPTGTYILSAAVNVPANRTLYGDGGNLSVIKAINNFATVGGLRVLLHGGNGVAKQWTCRNLGFDQNKSGYSVAPTDQGDCAVYAFGACDNLVVQGCTFKNLATGSAVIANGTNVLIADNDFLNEGFDGGAITNPLEINNGAKNVIVTGNYFDSTTDFLIGIENACTNVLVEGNVLYNKYTSSGNGAIGSLGTTGSNINQVVIRNNLIDVQATAGYAMRFAPSAASGIVELEISNNEIYSSAQAAGASAIQVSPAAAFTTGTYKHVTIKGNTIVGSTANTSITSRAIEVWKPDAATDQILYTTIEGNLFKQFSGEAVYIGSCFDVAIRDNNFWFCGEAVGGTRAAIRITTGATYNNLKQHVVSGNFTKGTGLYLVSCDNPAPGTVSDFIVNGNIMQNATSVMSNTAFDTSFVSTTARNSCTENMLQGRIVTDLAYTPATAASVGTAGEIRWDSGFIYVCTATNTWKKVAIATW